MKFCLCILLLWVNCALGASLNPKFVRALHQTETDGRYGAILGDHGKALGPFQIHKIYWRDSGVSGSYEQCSNYDYSLRVVTAYLNKYGEKYILSSDFKSLARIQNGGPNGIHNPNTLKYSNKVIDNLR